jgi:CDP-glucose 4,6-dehydratase
MALNQTYSGKKVLVTGHTGFKGAWLTTWLLNMGALVAGLSRDVPTHPSMFEVLGLEERISHHVTDVRDLSGIKRVIAAERPDFVIHLAAQAIVSQSYADPVETFQTNVLGTVNILEALRTVVHPCVAVMITSDKCYDNVEWDWGYRENDRLGGRDAYSGSKGAAELAIRSYVASFFKSGEGPIRLCVGRAGNVIGGGDWARDRIVADCMRAWSEGKPVDIRSPTATRPWQHVLEPLSGYLTLGSALAENSTLHGEAFNFGPRAEQNHTVLELLQDLAKSWRGISGQDVVNVVDSIPFHEAGLLKLNCDKALLRLKWEPNLTYRETVRFVGDWYGDFYDKRTDMFAFTQSQITEYESLARAHDRIWARV